MQVGRDEAARTANARQLQQKIDRKDDEPKRHGSHRDGHDGERSSHAADHQARTEPPGIERFNGGCAPEPFVLPQSLGPVNRRKQRADGADAAAGDDVELDARFVERTQDSGMIGAGGSSSSEHQRRAQSRGVGFGKREVRSHRLPCDHVASS